MKPFNDTYVMYQLLEFIDESSIICLCKASKKLNEICKQYIKLEDDERFKVSVRLFQKYCQYNKIIRHLKLITRLEEIELSGYLDWDWGLSSACRGGHMDIANLMIKKGANNWNIALYYACENGQMDCVKLMIEKGAESWNYALRYACKHDHLEIVKLMVEKGATTCGDVYDGCKRTMKEHLSDKK